MKQRKFIISMLFIYTAAVALYLAWIILPRDERQESPSLSVLNSSVVQASPSDSIDAAQVEKNVALPHFELSQRCAICHDFSERSNSQRDQQGNSVASYNLWQSSMMAQSSKDPYWRAVLSAEVANTPSQKSHIEDVCTRCHTPMATPFPPSPPGEVLSLLNRAGRQSELGLDGVSCTVCHQISDTNLGSSESFTGNFEINTESKIFGPHVDPVTGPMRNQVGFTPMHSPHIMKSALCATCHTVVTEAVTADGQPTGQFFHEQSPYLEWRNSIFNDEIDQPAQEAQSCQSCHMPTVGDDGNLIKTMLAHNPGGRDFPFLNPREPFGRHTLVGGNALMTRILRDNAKELGIDVARDAFDASLVQIEKMLRHQTATIEIGDINQVGNHLHIPISVTNLSGHKFPTAYPSRRSWIHLRVYDQDNNLMFVSGAYNDQGELVDQAENVLPSENLTGEILPHFQQIECSQQVQIYESLMGDIEGKPTFYLLQGASFLKDNRLLPTGWSFEHTDAEATMPVGVENDLDFIGGGDQLTYIVPKTSAGPFRIEASLLFQTISARHAVELFSNDTPEVVRFKAMYEAANRRPELIATQSVTIE